MLILWDPLKKMVIYCIHYLYICKHTWVGKNIWMGFWLFTVKYYDFVWIFIENRLKIQIHGYNSKEYWRVKKVSEQYLNTIHKAYTCQVVNSQIWNYPWLLNLIYLNPQNESHLRIKPSQCIIQEYISNSSTDLILLNINPSLTSRNWIFFCIWAWSNTNVCQAIPDDLAYWCTPRPHL